jgi:hypothetical protein
MTTVLASLAAVTAVGAAVRSTWSPCGLSMLSTITPLAERSRGRRWGATAAWFVLGAVLGGATLGLLAAALATLVGATGISASTAMGLAALVATAAAAADLGLLGPRLPHHRRQVDEVWLDQFRGWVYGAGFGWQIGTGVATYIMTAAVYLTLTLAALTGGATAAFLIAVLFGLVRGLAILLGARLDRPERLRVFHRRFEAAGPTVRRLVIGLQLAVAGVAAAAAWGAAGALVSLAVSLALTLGASRRPATAARSRADLRGPTLSA